MLKRIERGMQLVIKNVGRPVAPGDQKLTARLPARCYPHYSMAKNGHTVCLTVRWKWTIAASRTARICHSSRIFFFSIKDDSIQFVDCIDSSVWL